MNEEIFLEVDEILATVRHDITAVETNLEESKAKITSDTDQAVNALNGRIDFTNKAFSYLYVYYILHILIYYVLYKLYTIYYIFYMTYIMAILSIYVYDI